MNHFRNFTLLCLFVFCTVPVFAQPPSMWYDHPGTITLTDGSTKKGVIRTYGSDQAPWLFQGDILFMDSTVWMTLKKAKKKDFTEYEPKDLNGYQLHDLAQAYVSKPFSDLSSVSLRMIKKRYFMQAIALGRINLFHYYDAPPNFYVGSEEDYQKIKQESMNNYVLVEKEADKLKNITDIDIRKYIADCPEVISKYEAGDYGISPRDSDQKKGLGKFVARVMDSNKMKAYATPLFKDYNALCPEQK